MNLKYFSGFFFLLLASIATYGQNVPDVVNQGISGSVTNPIVLPQTLPTNNQLTFNRTFTPLFSTSDPNAIDESTLPTFCKMNTIYFDGNGNIIQGIQRYGALSSGDIVELYDNRPGPSQIKLLPYAGNANTKFRSNAYQEQKDYYTNLYPDEEGTGYSLSKYHFTGSDNIRSKTTYSPGKSTAGQGRGVTTTIGVNSANEVIKWAFDFGQYLPVNSGYYAAGELIKEVTINVEGEKSEDFKDKNGHLVCSRRYGGTLQSPVVQNSYTIYDDLGRVVFSISPKGYDAIVNGTAPLADIASRLCNSIEYDDQGRVVRKHVAGVNGNEYIIYNRKGQVTLVQDAVQHAQNKWSYTQYDKLGRIITSGVCINSNGYTQNDIQQWFDNASIGSAAVNNSSSIFYYLINPAAEGQHPASLSDADVYMESFYDDYTSSIAANRSFDGGKYFNNFATGITTYIPGTLLSNKVYGKLTARRTKILKPSGSLLADWKNEIFFYDTYENLIQTQLQNAKGGWDYISNQYDYSGKLLRTVNYQTNPACSLKSNTTIVTAYNYAPYSGLLSSVSQKIDNDDWRTLSTYTYDKLGRVSVKKIGNIETQNLSYNIRGSLTGINKEYAENGVSTAPTTFGEAIFYDHGFTNIRYDGEISGIIWKGANSMPSRAYGYSYDLSGRLTSADFTEQTVVNSYPLPLYTWTKNNVDYTVNNISYDLNGNIKSMDQRGMLNGVPEDIDKLSYDYTNHSNQLSSVSDAVTTSFVGTDFKDGNTSGADYEYDANGNLKKDLNKHISNIEYNELNQPVQIDLDAPNQGTIRYVYDALGNKLEEEITNAQTGIKTTIDYIGPVVYQNDELVYALNGEGKARYHKSGASMKWDYDFFVKDHLGNVRTVVTAESVPWQEYLATHELASANLESLVFAKLDEVREGKPESVDPSDQKAAELNGSDPNKRTGTSLLLKVMAGDQFELSTDAFYEMYNPDDDQPASSSEMLSSLVSALSGGVTGLEGWEGAGNGQELINRLFTPDVYGDAINNLLQQSTDPNKPKAYINYIVFDEQMHLVESESGAIQVGDAGAWETLSTANKLTIGRNGYLAIYINNSSNRSVFFDNIRLKVYKGALLDEHHYYPFGLAINDGSVNLLERKYLYQGKEFRHELDLNWLDFHARQYDPQIGRFLSLDPEGQFHSGYIGMGNNPVMITDPNGRWGGVDDVIAIVAGAVINVAINVYTKGGDVSFGEVCGYALTGALAGEATLYAGPAAGGAVMGIGNSMTNQLSTTGRINWATVAINGVSTAVISGIGGGIGGALTPALTKIASPVLRGVISNAIGGGIGGFTAGTIAGISQGKNFKESLGDGLQSAMIGTATGALMGGIDGLKVASKNNINPWTGESKTLSMGDMQPEAVAPEATTANVEEVEAPVPADVMEDGTVILSERPLSLNESLAKLKITTSSTATNPSRVYTIYKNGVLYKFGVTDEGLVRYNEVLKEAGPGAYGTYSQSVFTKAQAHMIEKYMRSLQYNSTGQYILDGMKVPYPRNFETGKIIRNPN